MMDEVKTVKPDLFGMITRPKEQFKRIRENPVIWGAMGIIIVLYMIGSYLTALGVESTELQGLELDEELVSAIKIFAHIGIMIGGIIIPILSTLFNSFIYWLIAKVFQPEGAAVSFRLLFSMNTFILLISALGLIINGIFIGFFGSSSDAPPTSLGAIIGSEGNVLFNQLEIFAIWNIILTAVGLQIVARFSKGLAWTVSIGFFVLGILLSMASAALSMMGN